MYIYKMACTLTEDVRVRPRKLVSQGGKFLTAPVKFMASAAQNTTSAVSIIYVFNRSRLGFK